MHFILIKIIKILEMKTKILFDLDGFLGDHLIDYSCLP